MYSKNKLNLQSKRSKVSKLLFRFGKLVVSPTDIGLVSLHLTVNLFVYHKNRASSLASNALTANRGSLLEKTFF
jgi:hypothetical protein